MRTLVRLFVLTAIFGVLASACFGSGQRPQETPVSTPVTTGTGSTGGTAEYSVPHSKPGPAVDRLEFGSFHVDQAVSKLEAGEMDLYLFGLKIAQAKEVENKSGAKAFRSPASSVSIILNPAPAADGKLNPFSLPEVRRAMNYLIDRKFVAQEIYGGLAVPMTSHVSPFDFDYLTVYDVLAKQNITHDFSYAETRVTQAMESAGAQRINGIWHYQGKPIRLKFIIRVEDERREVGDFIRVALEKLGFQVDPAYKTFAAAIFTVYTSDPQAFEWHLYTEGWGRGSAEKYDFATMNQMAAPWMGNLPGWQIVGFWQYQNEELDKLGKQLFTGVFSDKEERDEIYRKMTELALNEAVRIWVVNVFNTFPADSDLTGVTEDLVAGPRGILALREAFVPGKDRLRVGNLWVWTERTAWNPVGGFSDVYSVDIWKNLVDPPLISHPFSGMPIPFRVSFDVQTAGPNGKLDVPAGTVRWDAKQDRWQEVLGGTKATSKVIFDYSKYFQSSWHHGQAIDMADVIYGIYQTFEMTYDPEKSRIEFVLAATQKPLLDTFVGFRVLDENRIEVYLNFWHFEPNYIASYASLTSLPMPWEIMAAMDKLVFEDRMAAYSQAAAARFSVPWLSLVMGRDAAMVARALREFSAQTFVPESVFDLGGTGLVSLEAAKARYQAALAWFDSHGHLVVSQGPFFLSRYDPPAQYAELLAFRDAGYPFRPGDWYLGQAETVEFKDVEIRSGSAGEGLLVEVSLDGPGQLGLQAFVLDASSGTSQALKVEGGEAGKFTVHIDAAKTKGAQRVLRLSLLGYSDTIALVKEKQVDIPLQ